MSAPAALRVGRCPGALRPMMSGDGLIVRVKPRGGALSLEQARGLARASRRYGSGIIELTSRANLQIRGVGDDALQSLTEALSRLRLLDPNPDAEALRNVIASPLAGFDPAAVADIRPIAAALEHGLSIAEGLAGLPGKFGFAVDDGGGFGLRGCSADVRFEAVRRDGATAFAIRLGDAGDEVAGCAPDAVAAVATTLARAFVAARADDADIRRMRDLVARDGARAVFARAGLACGGPAAPSRSPDPKTAVGARPLGAGFFVGAAAPFGRLDAESFFSLADAAARAGASEIRASPWRALVVPGLAPGDAARLAADAARAGWIVDPDDPRLRVAACAGAPGCGRATTPVQADAARLAPLLPARRDRDGIVLHVSGCAKGCAHGGDAPLTLVGREGLYDAVRAGPVSGVPVLRGLDAAAAGRWVGESPGSRP